MLKTFLDTIDKFSFWMDNEDNGGHFIEILTRRWNGGNGFTKWTVTGLKGAPTPLSLAQHLEPRPLDNQL
jgi:hypothetical protein